MAKRDLMDGLTRQGNGFEPGETEKNIVSGNVKCLRLEEKDNKIKVS